MSAKLRAAIEPLHPSHDVEAFRCDEAHYLVSELHGYLANSPFVIGQRVLVSIIEGRVTGFLSLDDTKITFADRPDADEWHCLFVTSMAVSDDRRNTHDAVDLMTHALACIAPAESYTGRDYRAVVIQPETNPSLIAAAKNMGFQPLQGGFWGRELRQK